MCQLDANVATNVIVELVYIHWCDNWFNIYMMTQRLRWLISNDMIVGIIMHMAIDMACVSHIRTFDLVEMVYMHSSYSRHYDVVAEVAYFHWRDSWFGIYMMTWQLCWLIIDDMVVGMTMHLVANMAFVSHIRIFLWYDRTHHMLIIVFVKVFLV